MVYVLLAVFRSIYSAEQTEHRDFQYNSVVDPRTGMYNFAYDTGNDNEIAHNLHMQYRDENGVVRGRYGYTDPRGKLRVVEYEAGPNGFVARGDVGPDLFPHDKAPETQINEIASYTEEEAHHLIPRPVQMAGWNPSEDPMGKPVSTEGTESNPESTSFDGYATTNNTNVDDSGLYILPLAPFDLRYPKLAVSTNESGEGRETENLLNKDENENEFENMQEEYPVAGPVTVNNIDVSPDEIRAAETQDLSGSSSNPVRRSADGNSAAYTSALPYSYRNYRNPNYIRPSHDHDAELVKQATGYRVVYRPSHDHYNERYHRNHDHDAERRYVINRQTHDHDAEKRQAHDHAAERRYVSSRQTHDHDAERKWYLSHRYTHDHDAERKYVSGRQTHDHDAERNYYRTVYYQNNPDRQRIYYRDRHSMVPHEHYSDIYHNDRSHQHSDAHLYGRSQNLAYPATAKPSQLRYVPSDKYHDKYYYWTE